MTQRSGDPEWTLLGLACAVDPGPQSLLFLLKEIPSLC